MKKKTIIKILALTILIAILGMGLTRTYNRLRVIGEENLIITSTATASGLADIPKNAESALIGIQGDSVRWMAFNTDPESNNGPILDNGDYYLIDTPYELSKWKAILSAGGSAATVYALYYGLN